jgi:phosphoglucomutase
MAHLNAGKLTKKPIDTKKLTYDFYNPKHINPVKFGTSGHRGKLGQGFCHLHAKAIAQAVSRLHKEQNIKGPVLVGGDTRLMSKDTAKICAQVLTANGHKVILTDMPLPTPVFSFFILSAAASAGLNGTASHNPPEDMGLKYNPETGGPAPKEITNKIEQYANHYLGNINEIKSISVEDARKNKLILETNLIAPYTEKLAQTVNFETIKKSPVKIGIHPLGGTTIPYFEYIKEKYLSNLEMIDKTIDPDFKFIPLDHDGKIRMDPSSKYPLANILELAKKGNYDIIGVCDPDGDRFGIITKKGGLIMPNNVLCVMLYYLFENRKNFPQKLSAARSVGTTHLIDRICAAFGRPVTETGVGFKHFTTDKDGILAVMLAAEITAVTGKDISEIYGEITSLYGRPYYKRIDIAADKQAKKHLKTLTQKDILHLKSIAGENITKVRTDDGIKIYLQESWILARPSGTEDLIKLYAESFKNADQLDCVITEGTKVLGLKV